MPERETDVAGTSNVCNALPSSNGPYGCVVSATARNKRGAAAWVDIAPARDMPLGCRDHACSKGAKVDNECTQYMGLPKQSAESRCRWDKPRCLAATSQVGLCKWNDGMPVHLPIASVTCVCRTPAIFTQLTQPLSPITTRCWDRSPTPIWQVASQALLNKGSDIVLYLVDDMHMLLRMQILQQVRHG